METTRELYNARSITKVLTEWNGTVASAPLPSADPYQNPLCLHFWAFLPRLWSILEIPIIQNNAHNRASVPSLHMPGLADFSIRIY